jgi:glucosamine 6-phosphate synthetase-like amidotransferase/phosphosugar isomerase protein
MKSIEAMEKEIRYQVEDLQCLELPSRRNIDDCFITGSGDSYVASLFASYISNFRLKCCHPMDIVLNPSLVKNRSVYLVSVSGCTSATIRAAKRTKKLGFRAIAITANTHSHLARTCDDLILMKYKRTPTRTSGTVGFLASLLCCLSLVCKLDYFKISKRIFDESISTVAKLTNYNITRSSSNLFLGNGIQFPAAIYGSLKMNEIFGVRSFSYSLDEFCHAPIFSLKRNDRIIVLGHEFKEEHVTKRMNDILAELGVFVFYVDCAKSTLLEALLKSIFCLQLYASRAAVKNHLKDCYFLLNKKLLALSSELIYERKPG